jgi:hypothetical protein
VIERHGILVEDRDDAFISFAGLSARFRRFCITTDRSRWFRRQDQGLPVTAKVAKCDNPVILSRSAAAARVAAAHVSFFQVL